MGSCWNTECQILLTQIDADGYILNYIKALIIALWMIRLPSSNLAETVSLSNMPSKSCGTGKHLERELI